MNAASPFGWSSEAWAAAAAIGNFALAILAVGGLLQAWHGTKQARQETRDERARSDEQRRRDRSEVAARQLLEAVEDAEELAWRGSDILDQPDVLRPERRTLQRCFFAIDDHEVRERAEVCHLATFTLVAFRGELKNPGLAFLQWRALLTRTKWTLQAHLTDRPLPTWDGLPSRSEAQNWITDASQKTADRLSGHT